MDFNEFLQWENFNSGLTFKKTMKGSLLRKRYILIRADNDNSTLEIARRDLYRKFGCKEKFREGPFMIVLADQFTKDKAIGHINSIPGLKSVLTSGTIKKLKKAVEKMKQEDSSLLKDGGLLLRERKN
jgi:hypothetical protein